MLLESDKTLESGGGRSKSLAISVGFHLFLFMLALISPEFLSTAARRVIHISGEDFDRERFELTELVMPPDLLEPQPAPPPEPPPETPLVAVAPVIPIPAAPEAAPPPPPPAPEPEPEPDEDALLPPPIIGPDDVIEEGARPDAPVESPEGPDEEPRITLDEPEPNEELEGDNGDGGDGSDDGEPQPSLEEVEGQTRTEDEPEPDSRSNTNPDALLLPDLRRRASIIVEESVAESRREGGSGRSAGTDGIDDVVPDFSTADPTILSDTRGYDFGPYMNQVVNRVRVNWYSLIPQAARLQQLRGRVVIVFMIEKDGRVVDERFVAGSGNDLLDTAAISAIRASNPFSPVPDDFDGDNLVLQFTFLYNIS